jgi:hypothetical protein
VIWEDCGEILEAIVEGNDGVLDSAKATLVIEVATELEAIDRTLEAMLLELEESVELGTMLGSSENELPPMSIELAKEGDKLGETSWVLVVPASEF